MSIDWNRVGVRAVSVVYFAVTGSLMTRLITKIDVDPIVGAISGAIFGLLFSRDGKKDAAGLLELMLLNTVVFLPITCYYYAGETAVLAALGLAGVHVSHAVALSILIS